jgi:hypothetical protein
MIADIKAQRKVLEEEKKMKRAAFSAAKKDLKEIRSKKSKADRPTRSEIQNILEKFDISYAAYHGGDLNGVCARRLMANSSCIFI